jgi:hypothetical protein
LDRHEKLLTYSSAKSGPDRIHWINAEAEEITCFILSGTVIPIAFSAIPGDRLGDIVYYNPVVKQKLNDDGSIKFRVRCTAGGNLLDIPYDVSARTASLDVVKLLLQSTTSEGKKWFTVDIKYFYLGTPLPFPSSRFEYVRIERNKLPAVAIAAHNLEPLFHHNVIYFEIRKCMYALPQAGRPSELCLSFISHLQSHGYIQCPNTPCLFQHHTRDITLCLMVDDFGIKYGTKDDADHQDDADHLIATLQSNDYQLTIKPT